MCTRLPPCEGHSWSPTHLARSGGWQVGGQVVTLLEPPARSQCSTHTPAFLLLCRGPASLSACPLSVLYARLGRGRGSAHATFSPRPHRWVLRAARLQPRRKAPCPGAPSPAHASCWHHLNPGAPRVGLQDIHTSVEDTGLDPWATGPSFPLGPGGEGQRVCLTVLKVGLQHHAETADLYLPDALRGGVVLQGSADTHGVMM